MPLYSSQDFKNRPAICSLFHIKNHSSGFHQIMSPLDVTNKQLQKPQNLQVGSLRHR